MDLKRSAKADIRPCTYKPAGRATGDYVRFAPVATKFVRQRSMSRRVQQRNIRSAPSRGATHFLTKKLPKVATEMALNVLAYNMKRVMKIVSVGGLLAAMQA